MSPRLLAAFIAAAFAAVALQAQDEPVNEPTLPLELRLPQRQDFSLRFDGDPFGAVPDAASGQSRLPLLLNRDFERRPPQQARTDWAAKIRRTASRILSWRALILGTAGLIVFLAVGLSFVERRKARLRRGRRLRTAHSRTLEEVVASLQFGAPALGGAAASSDGEDLRRLNQGLEAAARPARKANSHQATASVER